MTNEVVMLFYHDWYNKKKKTHADLLNSLFIMDLALQGVIFGLSAGIDPDK